MTDSTTATDAARATRREWIGLAVLSVPALLASLELTVTHLALPAIGVGLSASSTQLLWIVDIYAFVLAGSLITIGKLGDWIGRRRLLLVGAAAYGVASALAAYAPTPELLIAARAFMGLAGATLMPSTLSLIMVMFRLARQRAVAVSVIVASVSGGTAIGPLVGGWLLERFWWGSAFLIGVPVMVLLLALGRVLLPEHRGAAERLDLVSAVLSMAAVLPLVYGLKRVAAEGLGLVAGVAVVVGVVFGWLFVRRQSKLDSPLVDLRLFRNRTFNLAVGTLVVGIFVLWGLNLLVAQYLQLVQGLSPLGAGLLTAPSAVGVIVGSVVAPRLARTFGPSRVIGVGLLLSALGFGVLTQVNGVGLLLVGTITVSAGLGPMMALATDLVIGAAPPSRAGMAAAISSTAPQLGGALGIAALGSVVVAVYRNGMSSVDVSAAARDSLASAVASGLSNDALATARESFVAGFHLVAVISAALMALTAVVVSRAPR
ncbi:MFS transporter [Tenggerimyces flavus]|uniref:MFS transporter n=1 Tax=Tenggerimyces flavus TaxID=1708749 RepID=A0ABV7Y983_9ACTN|nr:MFS transporter [Tenggerimyces flavus]MBM7785642.1 DHA2 family multidrug resistance protein-like MFS transporter [Tenggerimyces flavus]